MAVPTTSTYLADLFNPQVIAPMIDKKLTDDIKFAPLCRIDTTLVGRPGDTITLPSFAYIGDAAAVAEGADIPITKLTEGSVEATVTKIGKGLEFTDESILSGYGDPLSEGIRQIRVAIASKMDADILTVLGGIGAGMTFACAALATPDDISDALIKYGEDVDGAKVLLCSPDTYGGMRKTTSWVPNTEIGANMIISGAVGMVHGCQVIVTNRLAPGGAAYIVKPGALALYMKRDTTVETDRDIVAKSTIMTADKYFVAYLYDASKAIKLTEVTA